MTERLKKLHLLSDMISYSKETANVKFIKYSLLLKISEQMEVYKEDFDYLFNHTKQPLLCKENERIVQFYKLALLMVLSYKNSIDKVYFNLQNIGLRMGLRHQTVCKVFDLMQSFPNNYVPSDILIDLIKEQYN